MRNCSAGRVPTDWPFLAGNTRSEATTPNVSIALIGTR